MDVTVDPDTGAFTIIGAGLNTLVVSSVPVAIPMAMYTHFRRDPIDVPGKRTAYLVVHAMDRPMTPKEFDVETSEREDYCERRIRFNLHVNAPGNFRIDVSVSGHPEATSSWPFSVSVGEGRDRPIANLQRPPST
ncbi:MAG: DUF6941 family protein [Vicinamibacteria bacterium]